MKIEQFWKVFDSCGTVLSGKGYNFIGNSWIYRDDEFTLSFEAPSIHRYFHWLQVRFLTLCLAHTGVRGPDESEPWHAPTLNQNCPVQISPALLSRYKTAKFKRRIWRYRLPNAGRVPNQSCYLPVYYGGPDKWVLKEKTGSREQNHHALQETLGEYGISYVTEQGCVESIKFAVEAVAEAGMFWAQAMTPASVLSQLRRYGSDWWIENQWIREYQRLDV